MLELYTDKDGKLKQRECEDAKKATPKRDEIIVAYIEQFYDKNKELAIINNWIEVLANEATPPPADIVERRTKAYRKYQKVRKEAKAYADSILGTSED